MNHCLDCTDKDLRLFLLLRSALICEQSLINDQFPYRFHDPVVRDISMPFHNFLRRLFDGKGLMLRLRDDSGYPLLDLLGNDLDCGADPAPLTGPLIGYEGPSRLGKIKFKWDLFRVPAIEVFRLQGFGIVKAEQTPGSAAHTGTDNLFQHFRLFQDWPAAVDEKLLPDCFDFRRRGKVEKQFPQADNPFLCNRQIGGDEFSLPLQDLTDLLNDRRAALPAAGFDLLADHLSR